jgi:L,D-transpeptidase YcbB
MRTSLIFALLLSLLAALPAQADLQDELRMITEHLLLDGGGHLPSGGVVYQPEIIEEYYFDSDYQPAWSDRVQVARVLDILAASELEGLNPNDYHYGTLRSMWDRQAQSWENPDRRRARFDVLLTDGVILYIRHLLQGKVDPKQMDGAFNYARLDFDPKQVSANLRRAIASDTIADIMQQAMPEQNFYQQMKVALAYYRDLHVQAPFQTIPETVVLKPGETHPNVIPLRQRLAQIGYQSQTAGDSRYFDDALVQSVKAFQRDHGLDVDGIVGRQSYAFLNMSWADRVDTLRINMDRLRWIAQDTSEDVIIVNIAGFELYYMRNNAVVWETPVMTGTIQHQTPIFTSRLKYIEFNPTWTVPRSIIGRSLFPKFKANPQYVIDNNYHLYDRQGRLADPHKIDWSAYNGRNFPYSVVQQPWEKNALGRVKFIFPNKHAIYLHDTPSRDLFSRSSRAFSSGCVRVKHPLEFAEILLDDPDNWSLQQVRGLVDSREPQRRVHLDRDVDVMLMYWTTSPTREGRLQFHNDVYSKDQSALAALNAPPRVH